MVDAEKFLRKNNHALGTLTDEDWDTYLQAMVYYLKIETSTTNSNNTELIINTTPSGRDVMQADQLLHALLYEQATGASAAYHHARHLPALLFQTTRAWLKLSHQHGDSTLVLTKAEELWKKSLLWAARGWMSNEGLGELGADIVQAWLHRGTPLGVREACRRLVGDAYFAELPANKSLTEMYQKALSYSMDFEECGDLTASLMERMDELGIELNKEASSKLMDKLLVDSNINDQIRNVPNVEHTMVRREILKLLQEAGPEQASKVAEWIEYLESTKTTKHIGRDFAYALTEYFSRIKMPYEATRWLRELEQFPNNGPTLAQYQNVIASWEDCEDIGAPWRAEEMLHHLETVAEKAGWKVDPSTVALVMKLWAMSGDERATKRLVAFATRGGSVDYQALKVAVHMLLVYANPSKEALGLSLQLVEKLWSDYESEGKLEYILEDAAEAIRRTNQFESGFTLLNCLQRHNVVPTSAICERLIAASDFSDPTEVFTMFDELDTIGVQLSFGCYRSAILGLLKSNHPDTPILIKELFGCVFEDIRKKCLDAQAADVKKLLVNVVVHYFCVANDEESALNAAAIAEKNEVLGRSIDFYERVAAMCNSRGRHDAAILLFMRARDLYQTAPNKVPLSGEFFAIAYDALSKQGRDDYAVQSALILCDQCEMYKSIRDENLKPNLELFDDLIKVLRRRPKENVDIVQKLLHCRLSSQLDIDEQVSSFSNSAIQVVLKSGKPSVYQEVMQVLGEVKKANIQPNAFTFNTVLQACLTADTSDSDSALKIALTTLKRARDANALAPDTYKLMFRVFQHLKSVHLDPHLVSSSAFTAFDLCCKDGYLSEGVKRIAQSIIPNDYWEQVYTVRLQNEEEPEEWKVKV
jgi:hypothetical protein